METAFIIDWVTTVNGFSSRGGYSVVNAPNKNDARKLIRRQLHLCKGERLCITSVRAA